ncbi:hypothetical protein [Evansella tamaricis]|uniref:Uncharacterized protein n=1 Tax=Evansella tamaricis TaxID=2069301 RepID=A0ABS6JAG3_9BACI|nr:hypothetical protein [Evansella tamaricis]MBU9710672.1 hypothetical protein [Evansella tamaricis]
MGHDISGYNQAGEEIAYARFSMGNYNAFILYSLLDANKFNAGVSGSGESSNFTVQQMEEAWNNYNQQYNKEDSLTETDIFYWDKNQISEFLLNCLETAKKEGSVGVYFG